MSDTIFLKMTDLEGSVTTKGYEKQMGVLSMRHGMNMNCFTGGGTEGRTSGVCRHEEINLTKVMDKNSVKFNEWCCNAHLIPEIILTICRQEGDKIEPLIVYTLGDSLVSSYKVSAGGRNPTESITLNYARVKWEFTEQDDKGAKSGNVSATWDLQTNAPQG